MTRRDDEDAVGTREVRRVAEEDAIRSVSVEDDSPPDRFPTDLDRLSPPPAVVGLSGLSSSSSLCLRSILIRSNLARVDSFRSPGVFGAESFEDWDDLERGVVAIGGLRAVETDVEARAGVTREVVREFV